MGFSLQRTKFNSMHQIDDERVSGCQPAQQNRGRQRLSAPSPRFPPSPRQYEAHEFGLCEDEEFQHPRMFENLTYEKNADAFEAMRAENARPRYQQQPRFNVSDLPSEQLEDFSSPQFSGAYDEEDCNECSEQPQTPDICDISAPDFCDVSDASPWPDQTPPPRRAQSPSRQQQGQHYTSECLDDQSAPMYDSPGGSPTPQAHYTPIRLLDTPDVCAPSPPAPTPTPPPQFSPIRFQLSPVQYPSECLEDVTVPSFARTPCDMPTPPSPARIQMPQDLPSDMVCDVSAPSFRSPATPSLSFPGEPLDEITMPSFENASCGSPLDRRFLLDPRLADESPPSFAVSGASSSRRSHSRRDTSCVLMGTPPPACPTQRSVCQPSQQYEPTPMRKRTSPPRRFNLAQTMAQDYPPMQSSCPTDTPTPQAPHFSFYSPTPIGKDSLPGECLTDISEPTFFGASYRSSPHTRQFPGSLPSECLGDITEPSYQMTPPARTPSLPCDLPLEQICDMSQPMYDSPRSERLSSMSMPSFVDTSCGSPLDRRFLLDSRIMDESPPSFASSMPSSPRISPPCRSPSPRGPRSRAPTPQRTLFVPSFSPSPRQRLSRSPSPVCPLTPPAPHFSLRSPTPIRSPPMHSIPTDLPEECLADISEPAYFITPPRASPMRRYFPSNMTNECLADISAPSYEMTPPPRTPSMPHDLPSDMICDMSPPMYQSPASEHLSGESMPSFADTSCGSPLDRRFLLDPYLEDESMPTMVSAGSRSISPERSAPRAIGDSRFDGTYCEILQRFNALKGKMYSSQCGSPGSPSMSGGVMPPGECIRETVIERTENENGQLESTTQHIVVTIDPCGSMKTHTKEIRTQFPHQTPRRLVPPSADSGVLTQSPRPATQIENLRSSVRKRLGFDISDMPSENLADMSPPCADDLPSMSTENILQHLSSVPEEQLTDISAPSFRSPPIPSVSYPSEMLEQMSIPSFENASCGSPLDRRFLLDPRLADESPPTLASSYVSSPQASYATHSSVPSASGYTPYMRGRPHTHSPKQHSPQRAFEAEPASTTSPQRFSLRPSPRTASRSPTPVTPQAPYFSLHSPTPIGSPPGRSFPRSLPSGQLMDISEPAYFSGPPRASPQRRSLPKSIPSERLEDISQPSYQKTPPPRTPCTPTNLPSEMLGNVSAPSFSSPASEHISSVSMPSFADVSYESPLDRRFLLDPRLADESMPTLPRTPSTLQSSSTSRPGGARRRLSYSQPDSSRKSARREDTARSRSEGRKDLGEHGAATVEQTHITIKQSGTYQQQQKVSPARKDGSQTITQGERGQSPLMDALKEELKTTTSIHSVSHIYPQDSRGSRASRQAPSRSMSLPSENLGDISMPTMGMSTTGSSQQRKMSPASQNLNDISMPSGPTSTFMSTTGRSSPRTRRRRSVQDVNDISPISFATTIPSTNISGSSPGRGNSSRKYTSTSSRGLSGLANYAPFFEQIRSRNTSGTCDCCDPCSPCCPTVQNNDCSDPCAGFSNSNRSNKSDKR
ncbi:mucin-2 [Rhagoletis pomonella]|uniref:mucin-2 n=1 Tax=Rhagoletis pomonella TaxID=28610 RepID=UPI00177D493B|nr:mucin-2 [Rhagoletis pomonella]